MNNTSDSLFKKFIAGKRINDREFALLENLLDDKDHQQEIFQWIEKEWEHSEPEEVSLQFEQIREKIRSQSSRQRLNRWVTILSKAAAVLFIPLLATAVYFYISQAGSAELLTISTQKGEQTSIVLPDGSKVWLNVDTKLSYPVNYGIKSRKLELEGEAYFEVMKNKKLPFEVSSGGIITRAVGTTFVVSSYPGSSGIRSSLIDGSVEIQYGKGSKILEPGQQFIYNGDQAGVVVQSFNQNDELAWKNEQLIFRLTPFNEVIEKLKKWYDVGFEYNPAAFESETFTAKFKRSETLEHVLKIMAKADGFTYQIEGKTVRIMK